MNDFLKITLLSESTFGSSEGSNSWLDTDVEHDTETGLPEIGGKTVHGILADTWEGMSEAFASEQAIATRLLGRPQADLQDAIVHIGKARMGRNLQDWLRNEGHEIPPARVLGALSRVRTQTAIERRTGAAKAETLRSSRVLLDGLTLFAPLTWLEAPTEGEKSWFDRLCRLTRHAGLARNRGRGHICLEYLQSPPSTGENPQHDQAFIRTPICYIPYRFVLNAPALVTALGGAPNEALGLPYIGGSQVRGAVASRCDLQQLSDLVLSDKVRYLNVYLEPSSGKRLRPRSISLKVAKSLSQEEEYSDQAFDLLAYESGNWPEEALRDPSTAFCDGFGQVYSVDMQLKVHHQRDRIKGRATDGNIFAYQAIRQGQPFAGVVQITGETLEETRSLAQQLHGLLQQPLTLGRSRRAEYGAVVKLDLQFNESQENEYDPEIDSIDQGEFVCQLTAPYLGRNQWGQYDPSSFSTALEQAFEGKAAVRRVIWGSTLVGGYNRKWSTELPQGQALMAGSMLLLEAKEPINVNTLKRVVDAGLGERTNEGFGRFIFLRQPQKRPTLARGTTQREILDSPSDGVASLEMLEERLFWQAVGEQLMLKLTVQALKATNLPKPSLLGRLRTLMRDNISALESNLAELRDTALRQLNRCQLEAWSSLSEGDIGVSRRDSLRNFLDDLNQPWDRLYSALDRWLELNQVCNRLGLPHDYPQQQPLILRLRDQVAFELLWKLAKLAKVEGGRRE